MQYILFSSLALIAASLHLNGDYMYFQWSIGLGFCVFPIAHYVTRRLGMWMGVAVGYFGIYSVYIIMNSHGRYASYPEVLRDSLSASASLALIFSILLLFGALHMPRRFLDSMRVAIPTLTTCNALYAIHSAITGFRLGGGNGYTSFLDYAGMSSTLMALGCAFLVPEKKDAPLAYKLKIFALCISFAGIVVSKGAIAFGVLGLICASRIRRVWPMVACLLAGGAVVGSKMINSSNRFDAYKVFVTHQIKMGSAGLGSGPGSFPVLAPTIQMMNNFMMEVVDGKMKGWWWPWLHSDFLQIFTELGIFGFVLSVYVYGSALICALKSKDYDLFSLGVGLGGAALLNYPFRYFSTAFLVVYFLVQALDSKKPNRAGTQGP